MLTVSSGETDPAKIAQAFRTIPVPGALAGNMVVLNDSGLVPVGFLPGYCARVYLAADQSGNAVNAYTKINFDTVDYDVNSFWNAANKRFIPTVAGTYWAVCTCENITSLAYANTQAGAAAISKNGTRLQGQTLAAFNTGGSGDSFCQTGSLVQVNGTTDYIEGMGGALAASGTVKFAASGSSGTSLIIFRVGP